MRKHCGAISGVTMTAVFMLVTSSVLAGSLDPTNAPEPTMHGLDEIYQKQMDTYQKVDAFVNPQTLSSTTTVVDAGYYEGTTLSSVDTNLAAGNIKTNVTIFGIAGTLSGDASTIGMALVPKTGQTTSYLVADDGAYQEGLVWPSPRFIAGSGLSANCITDALTGLMWLRNPGSTSWNWASSISYCENLNGDGDRGGHTDWRMPNLRELQSVVDYGRSGPALPEASPFENVWSGTYWSSTTLTGDVSQAWYVNFDHGSVNGMAKSSNIPLVWPVRSGE